MRSTAHQYVHSIARVDPRVYEILRAYHWPGNVRELFHVLDYAQNVSDSTVLYPEQLPSYLLRNQPSQSSASPQPISFSNTSLQALLDDYERDIIAQALEHCGYNISKTAHTLGILRQSLHTGFGSTVWSFDRSGRQ